MQALDTSWQAYRKTPTPENLDAVMKAADPTINSALTTYAPKSSPALRARARILAKRAIDSYDPSKGASLNTHLMGQLRPLYREAGAYNTLHVPERVRMDLRAVREREAQFVEEHGYEPSLDELADYTGLSKSRIQHIHKYDKSVVAENRFAEADDEASSMYMPTISEEDDLWEEFVYEGLSESDKVIYDMKTGRKTGKPMATSEIARKLGVSPSAVSQRLALVSSKIQERPE